MPRSSSTSAADSRILLARGQLVEDVTVSACPTKLLFITNQQASELKLKGVDYFCLAMDIRPRPQFVINLQNSKATWPKGCRTQTHWKQHNRTFKNDEPWIRADCYNAEIGGLEGIKATDRRLATFLKQCVLPLAVRTNALVDARVG